MISGKNENVKTVSQVRKPQTPKFYLEGRESRTPWKSTESNTFQLGGSEKQMVAWLFAWVNSKLESWKKKLRSKVGKEVLIKVVVRAIPQYVISIFKIPMSCYWTKNSQLTVEKQDKQVGIHRTNWGILKTGKDSSELGFRGSVTFNKAMLGKQARRIAQQP